jgi:cysteine synthase
MMDHCLADGISTHGLANSLCAFKPGLKVLYTCSKEMSAEDRAALAAEGAAFIQKPYTPDKLLCAVQNSLGEES